MTYTEATVFIKIDQIIPKAEVLKVALFSKPCFAPPVLDDMMPDINRLMHSVASRFSDHTTPQLQHDELLGQARLKLAEIITKGQVEAQATREHFFKFFKTALNNQACSLVQKYRFTEKRTGVKPPPRTNRVYNNVPSKGEEEEDEWQVPEYHKNVELSLDDEDLNLQVPDAGGCDEDAAYEDAAKEYMVLLTEQEQFVFQRMAHTTILASYLAEMDARRGKPLGKPFRIRITHEHIKEAAGLKDGWTFEDYVLSIRQKISVYRAMSDEERHQLARRGALIAQLNEVFGLQIPPDTDDMLTRRILTIAARDQFQKVRDNPQIVEMLEEIGAKVPRLQGNNQLGCYGVLYQRNSRICLKCDLRKSCSVEAANVGLGKIVLSPRLLGSRQTRTPVVLPKMEDEPIQEPTPEELDWLGYMEETFTPTRKRDGCYFLFAPEEDKERKPLFFVAAAPPYRLRFINPSDDLKKRLEFNKRSWYPPERSSNADICALVDQHAEEQMKQVRTHA